MKSECKLNTWLRWSTINLGDDQIVHRAPIGRQERLPQGFQFMTINRICFRNDDERQNRDAPKNMHRRIENDFIPSQSLFRTRRSSRWFNLFAPMKRKRAEQLDVVRLDNEALLLWDCFDHGALKLFLVEGQKIRLVFFIHVKCHINVLGPSFRRV